MRIGREFGTAREPGGGGGGSRRSRARSGWALAIALVATTSATAVFAATEEARLNASGGADGDRFGHSVSVSGDRLAVGANADRGDGFGAVYAFERDAESGEWVARQRLRRSAENRAPGADPDPIEFGSSVAIDGELLLVGARTEDAPGFNSGAAYLFERDATGAWTERARLVPSDGERLDYFGNVVALSGERLVIGGASPDTVYVFEPAADGTGWTQTARLVPDEPAVLENDVWFDNSLQASLAIEGDRIVVGAQIIIGRSGDYIPAAYVFERDAAGNWGQAAKLSPPGEGFLDVNGVTVDLSDGRVAVGVAVTSDTHVYERRGEGDWENAATLSSSAGFENLTVALDGDRLVTGGYGYIFGDPGSAFVFERDASGSWTEIERLQPSGSATGDSFGEALSLDGDTLVVGSIEDGSVEGENTAKGPGSAYVFGFAGGGDADGDGVFDASDRCPATAVPEARVPAGGPSEIARFALRGERNGDGAALFTRPRDSARIPIDRSGGCSCEQLLVREFGSFDLADPASLLPLMRVLDQWYGGCYTSTVRGR